MSATDPQSGADPEQSSTLNKREGTSALLASLPTEKQKTCPHPLPEIGHLRADNIRICYHCWGRLDENLKLIIEDTFSVEPEAPEPMALPAEPSGKSEETRPPAASGESVAA